MSQFNKHNPDSRIYHLKIVKQVIRYLKGIIYLRLKYRDTFQSDWQTYALLVFPSYRLVDYTNNNYAGNSKDRESIIENCFYMNKAIVSWYNKKQQIILTFIIRAKYIAFNFVAHENI